MSSSGIFISQNCVFLFAQSNILQSIEALEICWASPQLDLNLKSLMFDQIFQKPLRQGCKYVVISISLRPKMGQYFTESYGVCLSFMWFYYSVQDIMLYVLRRHIVTTKPEVTSLDPNRMFRLPGLEIFRY